MKLSEQLRQYFLEFGLGLTVPDEEELYAKVEALEEENAELKETIKIARNLAYESPELNMSNFNIDDVDKLNSDMCELLAILDEFDE